MYINVNKNTLIQSNVLCFNKSVLPWYSLPDATRGEEWSASRVQPAEDANKTDHIFFSTVDCTFWLVWIKLPCPVSSAASALVLKIDEPPVQKGVAEKNREKNAHWPPPEHTVFLWQKNMSSPPYHTTIPRRHSTDRWSSQSAVVRCSCNSKMAPRTNQYTSGARNENKLLINIQSIWRLPSALRVY